jgi:hypothetical protein
MVQGRSIGLGVHARSVVAVAIDGQSGEIQRRTMTPDRGGILAWIGSLPEVSSSSTIAETSATCARCRSGRGGAAGTGSGAPFCAGGAVRESSRMVVTRKVRVDDAVPVRPIGHGDRRAVGGRLDPVAHLLCGEVGMGAQDQRDGPGDVGGREAGAVHFRVTEYRCRDNDLHARGRDIHVVTGIGERPDDVIGVARRHRNDVREFGRIRRGIGRQILSLAIVPAAATMIRFFFAARATAGRRTFPGLATVTEMFTTCAFAAIAASMPAAMPAALPLLSPLVLVCLMGTIVTSGATPTNGTVSRCCAAITAVTLVP